QLVLIDSGAGLSFDKLVENIESLKFDPAKLTTIIATHAHIDHVGSLYQFQQKFGCKIIAHELDADAIEQGKVLAHIYGVDYTPCKIDTRVTGTTHKLNFGEYDLNLVHIPGHTPGGIAAYADINKKRILFGQDIHGPYRRAWGADLDIARDSLQKLVDLKADILCEGHFGVFEPAQAVESYIRNYMNRL
ncbi:MAG: MBL fold metallo-hydrolase, partial [Chloroflexi bacterium]|nr:MBL fold metallo-hydrolase [Chloroflexota bacterium]